MRDLLIVGACLGIVLALLAGERIWIKRLWKSIPTRVVVMGTRGKSSVVRLITAGLRGGGHRVAYKTTGSRAIIGYPNGDEHPVRRRSLPTPLEQRRILQLAKRSRANTVVVEAMSIRVESLRVELGKIVAPQIVAITSFRPDHLHDLPDPIHAFAEAVPLGAVVICPSNAPDNLRQRLVDRNIPVHAIDPDAGTRNLFSLPYQEWPINLALALEICRHLGVPAESALEGMRSIRPDLGALSAWRVDLAPGAWCAVNGFAANDPESTKLVLECALERWGQPHGFRVGLLNLRKDRGDRTEQWTDELCHGMWPLNRLAVVGAVPWSVQRRLRRAFGERLLIIRETAPDRILAEIASNHPEGGFLFGFGNMGGAGMRLVESWRQGGIPV